MSQSENLKDTGQVGFSNSDYTPYDLHSATLLINHLMKYLANGHTFVVRLRFLLMTMLPKRVGQRAPHYFQKGFPGFPGLEYDNWIVCHINNAGWKAT